MFVFCQNVVWVFFFIPPPSIAHAENGFYQFIKKYTVKLIS
jgi:hypothetical protein